MKKHRKSNSNKKDIAITKEKSKNENVANKNSAERLFEISHNVFRSHVEGGYFSFLLNSVKRTHSYKKYSELNSFFKPFVLIMRFFRVLFVAVAWIQASALLLVAVAVALVILPLLLLLIFIIALIARINLKYIKVKIAPRIDGKKVVIFFRERDFSCFFFENISELAENYTILVIIPYPIRIIKNKTKIFLNSEFLSQNIIIMREHCYFAIRNNLLKKAKRLLLVF